MNSPHIHSFNTECLGCGCTPEIGDGLTYQYRFVQAEGSNDVIIAIHANTYSKQLGFIMHLTDKLRMNIPGIWAERDEPSVEVLGGQCYKHMLQVQIPIKLPHVHHSNIPELFKARGYYEGLEPTL